MALRVAQPRSGSVLPVDRDQVLCARKDEHIRVFGVDAYFSPSWTPFQADRGRDFSVIVDGVSV